jgi:hypothetical protein
VSFPPILTEALSFIITQAITYNNHRSRAA